jgi:hypothetical protein
MNKEPTIRYHPDTDTMAIELRPWPEMPDGDRDQIGGQDAGEDLVIHYAADGRPWLWEIEQPPLTRSILWPRLPSFGTSLRHDCR